MPEFIQNLKAKVKVLKREIVVISYALSDHRTPFLAKVLAAVTVGYMLSPIDLIPDFIPVLGLLDDLILVPLLISLTLKLIPKNLTDEIRAKINTDEKLQKQWYFAIPVIIIYLLLFVCIYFKFFHQSV